MRKRKNEKKIRLTSKEIEHINKLVLHSKSPHESFLRMINNSLVPIPSPSKNLLIQFYS